MFSFLQYAVRTSLQYKNTGCLLFVACLMNNSNEYNTRQEIVGSLLVIFFLLKSIILLAAGGSEIYIYIYLFFANNSDIVPRAQ